jgi:hypothetical protein
VQRALREAGLDDAEVTAFHTEATAGDYDRLLQVVQEWVDHT